MLLYGKHSLIQVKFSGLQFCCSSLQCRCEWPLISFTYVPEAIWVEVTVVLKLYPSGSAAFCSKCRCLIREEKKSTINLTIRFKMLIFINHYVVLSFYVSKNIQNSDLLPTSAKPLWSYEGKVKLNHPVILECFAVSTQGKSEQNRWYITPYNIFILTQQQNRFDLSLQGYSCISPELNRLDRSSDALWLPLLWFWRYSGESLCTSEISSCFLFFDK